ncbi:MAG TPA: helicase-related protein, partial [Planctomycetaceae bacterium]|nr:helicase-related protein [Planctomycetaceae bacterium]
MPDPCADRGQLALPFGIEDDTSETTESCCDAMSRDRQGAEQTPCIRPLPDGRGSKFGCTIIDVGHSRPLKLAIEIPKLELGAVCSYEHWAEINARVVELINSHRSTLIFVNTRRLAERVAHQLTELLGEDAVSCHHGSLSFDMRLKAERRLKAGELKAIVATASLELGIDIGYIDLVIQIGSPGSIATFLQRIGRAGHAITATPKGRLFALTRDELLEAMAVMRAVRSGRLDVVAIPEAPLDVLAQQIVAEVAAAEEWSSDELFETFRRAYPYRNLTREAFDAVVQIMAEGITDTSGRGRVYLHHDRVKRRLKPRPSARIAATCNAGAIPDIGSFRVVTDPEGVVVGSVDEDFAVESQRGDIFLLGTTSWRFQGIRGLDVTVTDASGAPPTIPFWRGEAPGRTWELSEEVSRLR